MVESMAATFWSAISVRHTIAGRRLLVSNILGHVVNRSVLLLSNRFGRHNASVVSSNFLGHVVNRNVLLLRNRFGCQDNICKRRLIWRAYLNSISENQIKQIKKDMVVGNGINYCLYTEIVCYRAMLLEERKESPLPPTASLHAGTCNEPWLGQRLHRDRPPGPEYLRWI